VPPERLGELTTIIQNYLSTIDSVDRCLTDQIDEVNAFAENNKVHKEKFVLQQTDAKEAVKIHLETMLR
jgi:hypothetical protein